MLNVPSSTVSSTVSSSTSFLVKVGRILCPSDISWKQLNKKGSDRKARERNRAFWLEIILCLVAIVYNKDSISLFCCIKLNINILAFIILNFHNNSGIPIMILVWNCNVVWRINYSWLDIFLTNIYLFKVNNRNTIKICKIYSKSTIKTPERCHPEGL